MSIITSQLGIAVVGLNNRGQALVKGFAGDPRCRVVHLVEPDASAIPSQLHYLRQHGLPSPRVSADIREALLDPEVNAAAIAAPNHWHALMTAWACGAGRDVFVEKPCSHRLLEGRQQVRAAQITGRLVQVGTQRRSMGCYRAAVDFIRSGRAGRVLSAHAYCYRRRTGIGFQPVSPPPASLDYNLWLGPAPETDYHRNLLDGNWHWFPDFGNGELGAQAVHQLDVARWGLGDPGHPKRVVAIGGRFSFADQGQTPNTLLAVFDYGWTSITLEVRGLQTEPFPGWIPSFSNLGRIVGNLFRLEGGVLVDSLFFGNEGEVTPIATQDPMTDVVSGPTPFRNFVDAVHGTSPPDSDILQGHLSASLCHLAEISLARGEDVPLTDYLEGELAPGIGEEALDGFRAHLRELNLDPRLESVRIGRELHFLPEEHFVDDPASDALLGSQYRAGFEVPAFLSSVPDGAAVPATQHARPDD